MPTISLPSTPTTMTIGGASVNLPRDVVPRRLALPFQRGIPSFSFAVKGGALPTGLDPHCGKELVLTINGTERFRGDVTGVFPEYVKGMGWVRSYQSIGHADRANKFGHVDSRDSSAVSIYNMRADDDPINYNPSRIGRTVGEILTDILTMDVLAGRLDDAGLMAYTSLSPVTLPSATVSDLAALTRIPINSVRFGGEQFLGALTSFLSVQAPNHFAWFDPDGTLRIHDFRAFAASPTTFTWGTDPVIPTALSYDLSECYSRVEVRGDQIAEMGMFSVAFTTLSEDPFAHDGLNVADAKAAWKPSDYQNPELMGTAGPNADEGTCTCPNTTTVTITSSNASAAWAANYWDQTSTGRHGSLLLIYPAGTNIESIAQRRVASNPSLTAGGTCAMVVDLELPHTNFTKYMLRGLTGGASTVWTCYQLPTWAREVVAPHSQYPFAYRNAAGSGAMLTSTALGIVLYSNTGSAPYSEVTVEVRVEPDTGLVWFPYPTFLTAGGRVPSDVRAIVPLYTGANSVASPQDSGGSPVHSGTSHDYIERTLYVTIPGWRDPLQSTDAQAYADDLLDSVKDVVVEGGLSYLGFLEEALYPGLAVNVASANFTTGWEAVALPSTEANVEWNVNGVNFSTTLKCSNRRAHFSDEAFMHPARTGSIFDFGFLPPDYLAAMGAVGANNDPYGVFTAESNMVGNAFASGMQATYNTFNAGQAMAADAADPSHVMDNQWDGGLFYGIAGPNRRKKQREVLPGIMIRADPKPKDE